MFSSTMTFFYISLDKVKPIELNEEASVDTQIVSNTRLAHFEGFNNEMIYWFCAQIGCDRSDGQATSEFLKKYGDVGTLGFYHDDHRSTNSNVEPKTTLSQFFLSKKKLL
ncbi:unnamed protein product [Rotaria sp. Silwood1]|nr:unnamed protein product [Rotaria sp. Silwood1]